MKLLDAEAFLLRPRPLGLLLAGSFIVAIGFCLYLFDFGFVAGTSPYWAAPRGLVINGWADISTALSGYNYFVRDDWTLPIFQTSKLGAPDGTNIIFTDSIPIVAILGRLLYRVTGHAANLYGAWTALCFVGSALSMTGLVAVLGQRGVAAALMASVAGLCMPALLERWGHMSLMAQWQITLAFVFYFASRAPRRGHCIIGCSFLLCVIVVLTHAYLLVMVTGILAAALAQAVIDRRLAIANAALVAAVFAAALAGLMSLAGYASTHGSLAADGFGLMSLNLLSPVIPQFSGIFPFMGNRLVDGTGGQYEGFCYLGAGTLLLLTMTFPWLVRAAASSWPRHACISLVLLAMTLFAISNQVFAGVWHVATIPLPDPILAIAGVFRSSGRFVWPSVYLLTALLIVAAPSRLGRAGGWVLLVASVVQLADTAPLRTALAARVAGPQATPLVEDRWTAAIRQHDLVRVLPPVRCLSNPRGLAAQMAMELQLAASWENVATNTVYASRRKETCEQAAAAPLAPRELRVYLLTDRPADIPLDAANGCASSAVLAVCSRQLGAAGVEALIATVPQAPPQP